MWGKMGIDDNKRLLIVVNSLEYFYSHREQIAVEAKTMGFDVHVASPEKKVKLDERFSFHELKVGRGLSNPLRELLSIYHFSKLIKVIKPDIVHLVTLKPVVFGGFAVKLARSKASVLVAIAGLGSVFNSKKVKSVFAAQLIKLLIWLSLRNLKCGFIFQNDEDLNIVRGVTCVPEEYTYSTKGSGVDLNKFTATKSRRERVVVAFIGRLLKAKGVEDFVEVAKSVNQANFHTEFWIVGAQDPFNNDSVTERTVQSWEEIERLVFLGSRSDIPELLKSIDIVCFPSSYGEGTPKVLLEAAASGTAIVTTDHPGCRDAIVPGVSGVLVKTGDLAELKKEVGNLVNKPDVISAMGREGRHFAEGNFSVDKVAEIHMKAYRALLSYE